MSRADLRKGVGLIICTDPTAWAEPTSMGSKPKVPKVIVRPLPGDTAGLACKKDNTIEIDPHIVGAKENLRVLVHEGLHLADWKASERKVDNLSRKITDLLWSQGYRKTSL